MTATLTPQVDVRRAESGPNPPRLAGQQAQLQLQPALRSGQRPPRAAAGQQRRHRQAGRGLRTHPHQDMEIVTWVLQGSLVHQDSQGHTGVIYPGLAQRMSAGTGILHSEKNDSWRLAGRARRHQDPVHFVQMWVVPDEPGIIPATSSWRSTTSCSRRPCDRRLRHAGARRRRSHPDQEPVRRAARGPAAARPERAAARGAVPAPVRPAGRVTLEGTGSLEAGDAVRFTATGGQRVTATEPAEVLLWEMHATLS